MTKPRAELQMSIKSRSRCVLARCVDRNCSTGGMVTMKRNVSQFRALNVSLHELYKDTDINRLSKIVIASGR